MKSTYATLFDTIALQDTIETLLENGIDCDLGNPLEGYIFSTTNNSYCNFSSEIFDLIASKSKQSSFLEILVNTLFYFDFNYFLTVNRDNLYNGIITVLQMAQPNPQAMVKIIITFDVKLIQCYVRTNISGLFSQSFPKSKNVWESEELIRESAMHKILCDIGLLHPTQYSFNVDYNRDKEMHDKAQTLTRKIESDLRDQLQHPSRLQNMCVKIIRQWMTNQRQCDFDALHLPTKLRGMVAFEPEAAELTALNLDFKDSKTYVDIYDKCADES